MDSAQVLSRIGKLFVDRDGESVKSSGLRRSQHGIHLVCGLDVGASQGLLTALVTAANLANRCFPGRVFITIPDAVMATSVLALAATVSEFLAKVGARTFVPEADTSDEWSTIIIGDVSAEVDGLRITYDGWLASVGPVDQLSRLPERDFCPLAPMAAAALAVGEAFFQFAGVDIEAGRRLVSLSLWCPDRPADHVDALGVQVQFLPMEFWILGLGHLGQAYLWALNTLPFQGQPLVFLCDDDKVEPPNWETGVLLDQGDIGQFKTRAISNKLECLGFQTRIIERRLDANFRLQDGEPKLAFCGFDGNEARRFLPSSGFSQVIDCGLGGKVTNFDSISMHTVPNPGKPEDLWPLEDQDLAARHVDELVAGNSAYEELSVEACGRVELAGKSIAVPFVGVLAAALAVAEALKMLHKGPRVVDAKIRLSLAKGAEPLVQAAWTDPRATVGIRTSEI